MDLADVCFDIVEAIPHPYRFTFANQLIPSRHFHSVKYRRRQSAPNEGVPESSVLTHSAHTAKWRRCSN